MSSPGANFRRMVNILLISILILLIGGMIADWYNHSIRGNRLVLDPYQTFNIAYIKSDGDTWDKVEISSWSVNSTETGCQVVTTNGIPIYTSFNNIILTHEEEK